MRASGVTEDEGSGFGVRKVRSKYLGSSFFDCRIEFILEPRGVRSAYRTAYQPHVPLGHLPYRVIYVMLSHPRLRIAATRPTGAATRLRRKGENKENEVTKKSNKNPRHNPNWGGVRVSAGRPWNETNPGRYAFGHGRKHPSKKQRTNTGSSKPLRNDRRRARCVIADCPKIDYCEGKGEDKSAYKEREKPGMSAHHFETESSRASAPSPRRRASATPRCPPNCLLATGPSKWQHVVVLAAAEGTDIRIWTLRQGTSRWPESRGAVLAAGCVPSGGVDVRVASRGKNCEKDDE
ncbi:hypothetical protein K438DRAFT_1776584 [Mycena galopus ATCC 62051]|nr:hypothetical protein K438DRAFT_1776584 [Mycena galopus ATCC 62051]